MTSPERLRISVVIPTWNRCATLGTTLDRLAAQSLPPDAFDALVVDDGSADDTERAVRSRIGAMPYALRYLRHENRGVGYTQNRAISQARGALVLLLTDDLWATPGLLQAHLDAHARHPGANVAILGQVRQSPELPATVLHRYWDPFAFEALEGRSELTSLHFYACNISFYRRFLLAHGLFRERRAAANEDTELGYRLGRHGLRIFYASGAVGHHHHEETLDRLCGRAYELGRNFDMLDEVPRREMLPFCGMLTLDAGVGTALRALPKALVRACVFNAWLADRFWKPVLGAAERFAPARLFACRSAYRGLYGCYYRKGVRALRRAGASRT